MSEFSPMMQQYHNIKANYPHCILMFRLGDFYEMFFDDAKTASAVLGIALTARDSGKAERAAMCGVPFHAAEGYIARLVAAGHHVAVCDQVEDAKLAKGIVKREVVRVVTPGTVTDDKTLDESRNNYITCVAALQNEGFALATADITTGAFLVTQVENAHRLVDELERIAPAEVLLAEDFTLARVVENVTGRRATAAPPWTFNHAAAFKCLTEHFYTLHLEGFGLAQDAAEIPAAGALLAYLAETQKNTLAQITSLKIYSQKKFMALDAPSRRNLELTARMNDTGKKGSLLSVLDYTKTPMGARLLRSWVELPLLSVDEINHRQGAVAEWHSRPLERSDMRKLLANIRDLERLMARLLTRAATARDLANLRESLQYLPAVGRILNKLEAPAFVEMQRTYDNLSDICKLLSARIVENPPHSTGEGGMICPGNNQRLDELTHMRDNTAATLAQMEAREREATGIASLKVKSNRVFGYYIEVTTPNLPKVPPHYNRKQTIANGERFTTEELKELEQTILGAEEEINALEYSIFDATRRETLEHMARVQFTAAVLGTLDALQSLGEAAERGGYTRPTVDRGNEINIEDGTHPVLSAGQAGDFVPNSTQIGTAQHCLSIITGPNMSGKSTYMRQVALIVLMAQIGSFVPAKTARIGVRDRIFTRVGASDDIATGRSTFMVEMTEVANILNNATAHSLIILDEVGRGTSTYDGLSIAWAVLEHIAEHIGALTLFATHYHELTKLESHLPGVQNYYFATREKGEDIIFLRKLERGSASRSYGLHVARLAGLPKATLVRAEGLLRKLNKH